MMLTLNWIASEVTRRQRKKSPRGKTLNVAEVSDALSALHDLLADISWDSVANYYSGKRGMTRSLIRATCAAEGQSGAERAYELSIAQMGQVLKVEREVVGERSLEEVAAYFSRRRARARKK